MTNVAHPADTNFHEEGWLAEVARSLGFSIMIAQPLESADGPDLLGEWQVDKRLMPGVHFRWAAGGHQDLFPPVTMGRYLGGWYYLVARQFETYNALRSDDVSEE